MTDTTSIHLNKLVAWNGNVRKTAGADSALEQRPTALDVVLKRLARALLHAGKSHGWRPV
jgi:hypothetical protein